MAYQLVQSLSPSVRSRVQGRTQLSNTKGHIKLRAYDRAKLLLRLILGLFQVGYLHNSEVQQLLEIVFYRTGPGSKVQLSTANSVSACANFTVTDRKYNLSWCWQMACTREVISGSWIAVHDKVTSYNTQQCWCNTLHKEMAPHQWLTMSHANRDWTESSQLLIGSWIAVRNCIFLSVNAFIRWRINHMTTWGCCCHVILCRISSRVLQVEALQQHRCLHAGSSSMQWMYDWHLIGIA